MAWKSIGKVTVTTAGTPVRITSTRTQAHAILIQQIPGNTGRIIVGLSTMVVATYVGCLAILGIPTSSVIPAANAGIPIEPGGLNLADYYLDSTVNGEGALVSYLEA